VLDEVYRLLPEVLRPADDVRPLKLGWPFFLFVVFVLELERFLEAGE
jgi:hypothetical protein